MNSIKFLNNRGKRFFAVLIVGLLSGLCALSASGAAVGNKGPGEIKPPKLFGGVVIKNPHIKAPQAAPANPAPGGAKATAPILKKVVVVGKTNSMRRVAVKKPAVTWGTVVGKVLNPNGRPLAYARLVLRYPRGGVIPNVQARHITFSTKFGDYAMARVKPGIYRIVASYNNREVFQLIEVKKGVKMKVVMDFSLDGARGRGNVAPGGGRGNVAPNGVRGNVAPGGGRGNGAAVGGRGGRG